MTARRLVSTIAVAASIGVAAPGVACSYLGAPEPVGYPSATFLTKGLFASAAYVDLAVAETARPLSGSGEHYGTQAITFRVIQSWKGASPDRFVLFGQQLHADGMAGATGWFRNHWIDEQGRVTPHATPWESPTTSLHSMTSCDPGFIRPAPGRAYVIFRGPDGRLLGPVVHHPGTRPQRGLEFVEVTRPREDAWLDAAFLGGYQLADDAQRAPGTVAPMQALTPGRARVLFARPLDASAVAALLQSARARPYAVQSVAGGFVDEWRMPADRAAFSLLVDATAAARANASAPPPRAFARDLLKDLTPEQLENDGWFRSFATALVLAEEKRAMSGPPFVRSVEVLGDARAWAALRRDPRIARLEEGAPAPVRDGPAPPLTLEVQARALAPAFLLHQLRVIAGELPPTAPAPTRAAPPPPPDTRTCRRVGADTARAFPGLTLKGQVAGMRLYGESALTCRAPGPDGQTCTVAGPTRVRLELPSGGASGFEIPRAEPVTLRMTGTTFGCSAARER